MFTQKIAVESICTTLIVCCMVVCILKINLCREKKLIEYCSVVLRLIVHWFYCRNYKMASPICFHLSKKKTWWCWWLTIYGSLWQLAIHFHSLYFNLYSVCVTLFASFELAHAFVSISYIFSLSMFTLSPVCPIEVHFFWLLMVFRTSIWMRRIKTVTRRWTRNNLLEEILSEHEFVWND